MTEAPDPRTFKTWEDAFQYPVPAVRKLEQQLRSHAEENKQQLRTLVGVSYRNLLGTAERIIEMDTQMHETEVILGQAAQQCNSGVVDKIFKNYRTFQTESNAKNTKRNVLASQFAILQKCPVVMSRLLKRGASSLLAAKILVLGRLTHKTLSQDPNAPPLIEDLRRRLVSLRGKLLRAIDKRISAPEREVHSLLEDMSAFSLATSSTPTDVLKHFHRVRLEAIAWHMEQSSSIKDHVLKAVKLLLHTLQESQAIFPKRLADVLARLKDRPLIQQADVVSISEFSLPIHTRWLADELQNYTPWPRHDELQKAEAEKVIKAWAKQALSTFLETMKLVLEGEHDFEEIMALRKELLEAWPWSDKGLLGLNSADVVDKLRDLINKQLSIVITETVEELQALPNAISSSMKNLHTKIEEETSVWDDSVTSLDYSNGAAAFKEAIRNRYQGQTAETAAIITIYEKWISSITSIRSLLKEMKDTRWDDDLDDDMDDFDSRQTLLGEDDPRVLEEILSTSLGKASESLRPTLLESVTSTVESGNLEKSARLVFLLRTIRQLSHLYITRDIPIVNRALSCLSSADIINPLQTALGTLVSAQPMDSYQTSLKRLAKAQSLPARPLWEGSPPLPVQPSPGAIKLLRALNRDMASSGADLWSAGAVDSMKRSATERLLVMTSEFLSQMLSQSKLDVEKTNGHAQTDDADVESQSLSLLAHDQNNARDEKFTQLLLDNLYLRIALSPSTPDKDTSATIQPTVERLVEILKLDAAAVARLRKSAADYWKRTFLIFALLVN